MQFVSKNFFYELISAEKFNKKEKTKNIRTVLK